MLSKSKRPLHRFGSVARPDNICLFLKHDHHGYDMTEAYNFIEYSLSICNGTTRKTRGPRFGRQRLEVTCRCCVCKFCSGNRHSVCPFYTVFCFVAFLLSASNTMAFEKPAAKVSHPHISQLFFTQRAMHHMYISLVRQATAFGSMTELQGLLGLPRNPPNQTRRSAIRLW